MISRTALAALAVLLLSGTAAAETIRYSVDLNGPSQIVFESKAPLEKFEGKTGSVSGWFQADLDDLSAPVELEIQVELADFDTGKKKRNGHMRENHLETDRFPLAWFRGGRLLEGSAPGVAAGAAGDVILAGELDLHGVKRPVECRVTIERTGQGQVRIRTEFPVKLSDHDIERPKFLVMKLADEQKVRVDLVAEVER